MREVAPSRNSFHSPATILLLLTACAGQSAAPAAEPASASAAVTAAEASAPSGAAEAAVVEVPLSPATLDPAADLHPAVQYAYHAPAAASPKPARLVVYLVGKGNPPERGRAMGRTLAALGLLVLVPGYANDYDIRKLCEASTVPDEDCHAKLRTEAFEGRDLSPHISINRPNSLEARVARMLLALQTASPQLGWSRFLVRDRPRWESITVAGHSHGASTAALIGKLRRVERVVMLSGPFDNRAGSPAAWLGRKGLTPVDRVFGFSHSAEEQYQGHIKNWQALELGSLGPVTVLEKTPASGAPAVAFSGSHQIVTSLAPEGDANPHGMTTAGKASPRGPDGSYRFTPVWRYLFGL